MGLRTACRVPLSPPLCPSMMAIAAHAFPLTCFRLSATFLAHTHMSVSISHVVSSPIPTGLAPAVLLLPLHTTPKFDGTACPPGRNVMAPLLFASGRRHESPITPRSAAK